MSLGGSTVRQHVVEFIRGTGVITDGVVDATNLLTSTTPYSWQVPNDVARITVDGCAGGHGGESGGGSGSTWQGGGGGGATGMQCLSANCAVLPLSILLIRVGKEGTGNIAGIGVGNGGGGTGGEAGSTAGPTYIEGILPGPGIVSGNIWTFQLVEGLIPQGGNGSNSSSVAGRDGNRPDFAVGAGGTAGANTAGNGTPGVSGRSRVHGGSLYAAGGGAGGGSATSSSNTGGNGGASFATNTVDFGLTNFSIPQGGTGNTTGSQSRGGGGAGACGLFGRGGDGGDGGSNGGNATGYGAGGGGGGGGSNGGNGAPGYLRITYWSSD